MNEEVSCEKIEELKKMCCSDIEAKLVYDGSCIDLEPKLINPGEDFEWLGGPLIPYKNKTITTASFINKLRDLYPILDDVTIRCGSPDRLGASVSKGESSGYDYEQVFDRMVTYPSLLSTHGAHIYNITSDLSGYYRGFDRNGITHISKEVIKNSMAVFTCGDYNNVLSVVDIEGSIVYVPHTFSILASKTSDVYFSAVIYRTVKYSMEMLNTYRYTNSRRFYDTVFTSALERLYMKCEREYTSLSNIDIVEEFRNALSSLYSLKIGSESTPDDIMNIYQYSVLKNRNDIYRLQLSRAHTGRMKFASNYYNMGLAFGIGVSELLRSCGFENNGGTTWTKEVDIYPDKCYSDSVLYYMPDDVYHIKTLTFRFDRERFIDSLLFPYADGKHPNVSDSGGVCMGDELVHKWTELFMGDPGRDSAGDVSIQRMEKYFKPYVEELIDTLQIVNFDSSYTDMPCDFSYELSVVSEEECIVSDGEDLEPLNSEIVIPDEKGKRPTWRKL